VPTALQTVAQCNGSGVVTAPLNFNVPLSQSPEVAAALAALSSADELTNTTGNTAITLSSGELLRFVNLTVSGAASTRTVTLSNSNAVGGAVVSILCTAATLGTVIQFRRADNTVLIQYTEDGSNTPLAANFHYDGSNWRAGTISFQE
jgi:hypothetical protein